MRRQYLVYVHDLVMAALAFVLALYLRLGDAIYFYSPGLLLYGTIVFTAVAAVVFWPMGLYRGIWRYASLNDLIAITRSAFVTVLVFLSIMFFWTRLSELPRSLPFISFFVLVALLGAPRFLYRLAKDRAFDWKLDASRRTRIPVLLIGAGDGTELFIRALAGPTAPYRAVGILTDSPERRGRRIHDVEVLGGVDDLAAAVAKLALRGNRPQRLILTHDKMDGARIRALLEAAEAQGMTMARLPKLTDLKAGVADQVEVKPVAIEDLLGRPQTALDRDAMRALIYDRRVLVTGAGGSIGSELARQIADLEPAEIALVDNSEFNLYTIDMELGGRQPHLRRKAWLADVRDRKRIAELFAAFKPELVFHAAALKHVPLVEANPLEGIAVNVLGTVSVADACVASGVATMVLISTDKAVNPTSVMGATKRVAERYCAGLDRRGGATRLVAVRFGNVLGSTGSVVPLFQRQLAQGGPLTVTHPDMRRFFMTVREAVELVLQASALGSQGSQGRGRVFVLDMGEPIRILDLARQMIRLAGFRPEIDVGIEIVGIRPGEKLYEETVMGTESLHPTTCKGVQLAQSESDGDDVAPLIRELDAAIVGRNFGRATDMLKRLAPEFTMSGALDTSAATRSTAKNDARTAS